MNQKHCLWCLSLLEERASLFSLMTGNDVLCFQCRNNLKEKWDILYAEDMKIHYLVEYNDISRSLILQYKECHDEALKEVFYYPYLNYLRKKYKGYTLIPVPSSKLRTEERGFHAVIGMTEKLGLPILDCLEKSSGTDQKGKGAKARSFMKQVIRLRKNTVLPVSKVLLIDDIVTTGASLIGARDALKQQGVTEAEALCWAASAKLVELNRPKTFVSRLYSNYT